MVLVAALVTPPFFDALMAKPELGRVFLTEEGEKGRDRVVVLTHAFWGSRYGANPDILKRAIKLEGEDYQVVGVMPKDFEYPQGAHVLIPAAFTNAEKSAHDSFPIFAIGRLKPGVSMEQADTEFHMLARRSQQKYNRQPHRSQRPCGSAAQEHQRRFRRVYAHVEWRGPVRSADRLRQRGEPAVRPHLLANA
jgi:hypothetical protein